MLLGVMLVASMTPVSAASQVSSGLNAVSILVREGIGLDETLTFFYGVIAPLQINPGSPISNKPTEDNTLY